MTARRRRRGRPEDRLLPQARLAGPMAWIVAIMIFLTVLACAAGMALGRSAGALTEASANRLTVQVTEPDPARRAQTVDALATRLGAMAGIVRVEVVPQERLIAQLEPWLGSDMASAGLPVPALIDVDIGATGPQAAFVRARVDRTVGTAPGEARVEPHARYLRPAATLVATAGWIAAAIVAMLAFATGCVVVLAARGAHAAHRETIAIMHMLGATDHQVMRLFQRRITRDVSFGAAVGLVAAAAVILLVAKLSAFVQSDLLRTATLPLWSWLVPLALCVLFILLARFAARLTLRAALARAL